MPPTSPTFVDTTDYQAITPEKALVQQLQQLQKQIVASILAIDILEEANGKLYIVEYNDIPRLSGFSDELKYELVEVLRKEVL